MRHGLMRLPVCQLPGRWCVNRCMDGEHLEHRTCASVAGHTHMLVRAGAHTRRDANMADTTGVTTEKRNLSYYSRFYIDKD